MTQNLTPYTIAEFCQAMQRNEVRVNYDYQRSPKVWPTAARSFLIETILLGYPMPKISLYQITDVKTRKTLKEIVDGQQRSMTIFDFYNGKLRLDRKALPAEAAGKIYRELDEQWQYRFLNYALSVDLFIGATKEDIREVFRRMNSYTVPLNAEERRHSKFQGQFKWFVYRLTKRYSQALENIGAFTEKQLNRMQDAKLFSEIIHAMLKGITTTKDRELTRLYDEFDKNFAKEDVVEKRIAKAMDFLLEYKSLHQGPLMKPYQLMLLSWRLCIPKRPLPNSKSHIRSEGRGPRRTKSLKTLPVLPLQLMTRKATKNLRNSYKRVQKKLMWPSSERNALSGTAVLLKMTCRRHEAVPAICCSSTQSKCPTPEATR